jgi:D-alanyl-D-alanine carboxypeptidase
MASAWGGHRNGEIPFSAMVQVAGGWFRPDAAASAQRWVNECAQNGIVLRFSEGFRDIPTQRYWKRYWDNRGKPGNAATPGYSNHGWAMAADVDSGSYGNNSGSARYRAVTALGRKYGWSFNIDGEPWHAEYVGGSNSAGTNYTPIQTELEYLMTVADDIVAGMKVNTDAAAARIIEAVQRESRYRAYLNTDTGETLLVSWDTCATIGPTSNRDFLSAFGQEQITSAADVSRAVRFNADQMKTVVAHAAGIRAQLK